MRPNFPRNVENLIAQLRGLPTNFSKSSLRPTKTIDALIDFNLKSLNLGSARPEEMIMANWKDIVGEKNAHRSCPKTISRNTLLISVANSVLRNELEFEKVNILKRVQALSNCKKITGLRFIIG